MSSEPLLNNNNNSVANSCDLTVPTDDNSLNIANSTEIIDQNDISAITIDKNMNDTICTSENVTNSIDITPLLNDSSVNEDNIVNSTEITRQNQENNANDMRVETVDDTISVCESVANGSNNKTSTGIILTNGSMSTLPAYDSRSRITDEEVDYDWNNAQLSKVMYILGAGMLLLSIQAYLGMLLAYIYAYNGHYWFFSATYATILGSNVFIVVVSRIWKFSKEENIIQIIISSVVSIVTSAEIQFYYYDCNRHHVATLRTKSRAYYKQTLQHVDDLRYLLCMVTALQAVPQFFIQLALICLNSTEYYFVLPLQITLMTFALLCLICAIVTYRCCNYNEELGEKHRVSMLGLLLTCLSDLLYVVDIGSDVILVGKFIIFQQYLYACLTFIFITIPGYYITWLSHRRSKKNLQLNLPNLAKIIFNLDPLFGYWKSLKLIRKVKKIELNEPVDSGYSEERKKWHTALVKNNFNVAVLRYNENYTEASMQLILQIAILLGQFYSFSDIFHEDVLRSEGLQILAVFSSLINLAFGSVTMFRSKRINRYIDNEELMEDDPLKWSGMIIQFMGYFPVMVTRILAISFAASRFPGETTGIVILTWTSVFFTLRPEWNLAEIIYTLGQSAIYTFTPPINRLSIEMYFHSIYLLQNVLGTLAWAYTRLPQPTILAVCLPVGIIFTFNVTGIACRIWYRKCYDKYMKIPIEDNAAN